MFYIGGRVTPGTTGQGYKIGRATSTDGIAWTKYAGNPFLKASGVPGAADKSGVGDGVTVYRDGDEYRVMYRGFGGTPRHISVCLTTSVAVPLADAGAPVDAGTRTDAGAPSDASTLRDGSVDTEGGDPAGGPVTNAPGDTNSGAPRGRGVATEDAGTQAALNAPSDSGGCSTSSRRGGRAGAVVIFVAAFASLRRRRSARWTL